MKDTFYPAFRGDNRQLRLRLRKVGMVFVTCDDAGVMIESPTGDGDWLAELLFTSEIVKEAMKEATQQWAQQDHPRVLEALPGLWLAPSEIRDRRKCSGYALAAILTNQFALSENFSKMCHVAGLAPETTRVKLENLPPVAPLEINRMADFVRYLCEDNATMITDHIVLENLGQQLAESYEEINLLYTITQSITQVDRTENFIAIVCRALPATLPYAWIGALSADERRPRPAVVVAPVGLLHLDHVGPHVGQHHPAYGARQYLRQVQNNHAGQGKGIRVTNHTSHHSRILPPR